jgi:hypothetical protein
MFLSIDFALFYLVLNHIRMKNNNLHLIIFLFLLYIHPLILDLIFLPV